MSTIAADEDGYTVQTQQPSQELPIIDLSLLRQDFEIRAQLISLVRDASRAFGFFHIINHGIPESVVEAAMEVNSEFFDLPMAVKEELMSDDVHKPVRYSKVEHDGQLLRNFLKLYANPPENYLTYWPSYPTSYREKMATYSTEVRKLAIQVLELIMESLYLGSTYLKQNLEQGMQIMAVNSYPPRSESEMKMGILPHSDHTIITVLLQRCSGLHILEGAKGSTWKAVPELKGSLQVLVGDHLEVISNGLYKSVLHRAIPSFNERRISIVSLHSLAMDEIVEPAMELVDEEHPIKYKGSSLKDFLKHLKSGEGKKRFIETLKIQM